MHDRNIFLHLFRRWCWWCCWWCCMQFTTTGIILRLYVCLSICEFSQSFCYLFNVCTHRIQLILFATLVIPIPISTTLYFPCFVYLLLFPSFSFIYKPHRKYFIYYMFVYQKKQQQLLQLTKFQSIKDLSIFYNLYALVSLCNTHSYNFVL